MILGIVPHTCYRLHARRIEDELLGQSAGFELELNIIGLQNRAREPETNCLVAFIFSSKL